MKKNKVERNKERWLLKQQTARKDKVKEWLIYGAILAVCTVFLVLKGKYGNIVGYDIKYTIFIVVLPIVAGVAAGAYLLYRQRNAERKPKKKLNVFFVSLFALVLSGGAGYITLGAIAYTVFNFVNYKVAESNALKVVTLPSYKLYEKREGTGKRHNSPNLMIFTFRGHKERIEFSDKDFKELIGKSHIRHRLELELREGIWNYYSLEYWDIVE